MNDPSAAATPQPHDDAGAVALLQSLATRELEEAYRLAKADETVKGQHAAWLISRELIRRATQETRHE
jgi:hypothetical protein